MKTLEEDRAYILLHDNEPFNDDCLTCGKDGDVLTPLVYNKNTKGIGIFKTLTEALKHLGIEVSYIKVSHIKTGFIINDTTKVVVLKDNDGITGYYNIENITLWDAFQDFYHIDTVNSLKGYRLYRADKSVGFIDIPQ